QVLAASPRLATPFLEAARLPRSRDETRFESAGRDDQIVRHVVLRKILDLPRPADKSVPAPVREQHPSPAQSHHLATGFWRAAIRIGDALPETRDPCRGRA